MGQFKKKKKSLSRVSVFTLARLQKLQETSQC